MLTEEQIVKQRNEIISALLRVDRAGIHQVIAYLFTSGFFTAPSSVGRHHNWKGGLAEHCLGVYHRALKMAEDLPADSIAIAGLLHDICKASKLYYDGQGNLQRRPVHIKGHGYRSVKLLDLCGLAMTENERRTIRWHMGGHHAAESEQEEVAQTRRLRLWQVIHKADMMDAKYGSAEVVD